MVVIRKLRLYLETTLFNYYFDEERDGHADTVKLFEAIGTGKYEGYTSEYVIFELKNSYEPKRSDMLALLNKYNIVVLEADDESKLLAYKYISEHVISDNYLLDCLHIASASVHGLDCVMSFNYKHINRLRTKQMAALINLNEGYKTVIICTPMEVMDNETLQ
jgi:predicted nucleic acid-binding protein